MKNQPIKGVNCQELRLEYTSSHGPPRREKMQKQEKGLKGEGVSKQRAQALTQRLWGRGAEDDRQYRHKGRNVK